MATWVWIVIAIVVVAVIVLVAFGVMRRRTSALRQRFGPEYDRTVEAREHKRAAEAELRAREKQRAQFTIKPLPEAERLRFASEWRNVQERFVDQPAQAVAAADALVTRVMEARGYPTAEFEAQAGVISVDHPDVVQNYRSGHAIWQRAQTERVSTEEMREALLRYRSLFDELLQPDAAGADATGAPPAGGQERAPTSAGDGTGAVAPAGSDTGTATPAGSDTGTATPAGSDTGAVRARPAEGTAAPTAEAAAPQAGAPAAEDQPTRGGRS